MVGGLPRQKRGRDWNAARVGASGTMFASASCDSGSTTKSSPDLAASRTIACHFFSFPFLMLLNGCDAKPECDSIETRTAILNLVSSDHANPLVAYAARNSTANKDDASKTGSGENKSAGADSMKPMYLLVKEWSPPRPAKTSARCNVAAGFLWRSAI
jgi:hypothetical protein